MWIKEHYPCPNIFCKKNSERFCDAGNMLEFLCSSRDIYLQCKERCYTMILMNSLEKNLNIRMNKDNKGNFFECSNDKSKKFFKTTKRLV